MGLMKNLMIGIHKRTGDRFAGMDLLYLTTVGAKSGKERVSPVARFGDGDGAWLVVASNNGAERNPAWYHNLKAHPDQVWIEHGGSRRPATPRELTGAEREAALQRIVAAQPRFAGYLKKTSRALPVIRLT
ncbi:nitroreductase family deazaflavin-dependent oxidoreductase [Dactylosporangium vinaceum]|uniref:Nitroreductase family deazaflavin-dependent oxidoreductase n=1 Tax=Dactylosporangium vinaceum TaxID=53362 RepID=A0ABV5M1N5_9ACTN|nr:nitroreductase family deazaflavin-dependent oxidoreductase [Dactylosporangium vinaceum]